MNDNFDGQIEGQMSIEDLFKPPERLFAVSRIFSRARKEMSLAEQKTFVYALSEMRFTEESNSEIVFLDKKTLANICGVKSDANHLSVDLHNLIRDLAKHSEVHFSKEDVGLYDDGQIITRVTMFKNRVRVKFEKDYLSLFTGLTTDYLTMWSSDIFQMTSKRSVQFYEFLRQNTDTRKDVNCIGLGVKAFKEMFSIPQEGKGSYMKSDGHFNRTEFEKKIIQSLCNDLKDCKMIHLVTQPDGKPYEKVKQGKRVLGYRFYWTFSARPGIASAEEVKQIKESVEKDPQVLKVARDIVKGKQNPKKKQKKNDFTEFEQRNYDFDDLESSLLKAQK